MERRIYGRRIEGSKAKKLSLGTEQTQSHKEILEKGHVSESDVKKLIM